MQCQIDVTSKMQLYQGDDTRIVIRSESDVQLGGCLEPSHLCPDAFLHFVGVRIVTGHHALVECDCEAEVWMHVLRILSHTRPGMHSNIWEANYLSPGVGITRRVGPQEGV